MENADRTLLLGPVAFFGLTFYTRVTQGEPEIVYVDPAVLNPAEEIIAVSKAPRDLNPIAGYAHNSEQLALIDRAARPAPPVASGQENAPGQSLATLPAQPALFFDPPGPNPGASAPAPGAPASERPAPAISPGPALLRQTNPGFARAEADRSVTRAPDVAQVPPGVTAAPSLAVPAPHPTVSSAPQRAAAPAPLGTLTAPGAPPQVAPLRWLTITGERVNLRAGPGIAQPSRRLIPKDARAILLLRLGDWHLINFPDAQPPVTGWIHTRFVSGAR